MTKIPLSVILMVHNEEETIEREVKSYYREIIKKIPGSEMIIVDDGNTDKTGKILHSLTKKLPLILLPTSKKIGYASSLRLSLEKAKGEVVFYADAGGKHDPKDFWKLYKYSATYDLISGCKTKRQDPWFRLFLAKGLNIIVNLYFGISFNDIDSGYKLLKKEIVHSVLLEPWTLKDNISLEIILRAVYAGARTKEIPIKHFARRGESRGMPTKKIPKVIFTLLSTFPKIKKDLEVLHERLSQQSMVGGYNELFPTNKYREIWEGKISVVYKLPKYLSIIKRFWTSQNDEHRIFIRNKKLNVLEVGCGDGEIAQALLNSDIPIASYTATELTKGGVKTANKKLRRYKMAKVLQADVTNLLFKDKSFDTSFSFDVMHHVGNPAEMAKELVRVTKEQILLIESNGLSIARRLAEQQIRYKKIGEKSYFPWEYRHFFSLPRVEDFRIKPFLFMFPHCPSFLIPLNIFISEILEKIPLFNWQCSGVIIEVSLKS